MEQIVLASASPRRAELLNQIGVKFTIIPSNIEENIDLSLSPCEVVQNLSYDKAFNIANLLRRQSDSLHGMIQNTVVVGADTIVYKDEILGKPIDKEHAFTMLKSLENDWHEVLTGITVVDLGTLKAVKGFERTKVRMRRMTDNLINAYIATGEPMDKAGAYGIQGMGALLVEEIQGCYFNVVGLPLLKLSRILEDFRILVL